jgi:hypothetical protein
VRSLPLVALLLCVACAPAAPTAPEPVFRVPVFVDDAPAGTLSLPDGPGPWPLFSHLPDGVPAPGDWTSVVVEGEGGQVFSRRNPAANAGNEEARFYRRQGAIAFALFLRVTEDSPKAIKLRAVRPSLAVPSPVAVRIRTVAPSTTPRLPPLRSAVDGRGAGRFHTKELEPIERLAEPGRPEHVDLIPLAALVALRTDGPVASVALSGETTIEIAGSDLSGDDLLALKPTRRGSWVYKRFRDGDRVETIRAIEALEITLSR